MKAGFVAASAALVGSVVAVNHPAHAGFHLRRNGGYDSEICTVYTTVYVTASEVPSMASNTTVYVAPTPVPETSTTCTEEHTTSSSPVYVAPPAPSSNSTKETYVAPAAPYSSATKETYAAPPAPSSSTKETYMAPAPSPSTKETHAAPAPSSSAKETYEAPAPSTKETYGAPAPSTKETYVASPTPSKSEKPVYTPVVPSSSSEKPKPTQPSSGSGSYGGRITPNGQKWSVTFTPYAANGQCMSASEVSSAIEKIAGAGYTTIRVYSTDCGLFENVVPACTKHNLKIIYGIFLDASKAPNSSGANEQLQAIIENAPKDSMAMLIVGNEYIFGHGGSASELAPYIKTCKEKLVAAGFSADIPVTTTEPVGTWEQYGSQLCDVIDVFTCQVHPFFDGGISASGAGDFALKQLEQAAKVCPGAAAKGKYISEIGWPKGGQVNGVAIPSPEEQKKAIASIIEKVGDKACLFSYQDDAWKAPGAFGVEQKFGCGDIL